MSGIARTFACRFSIAFALVVLFAADARAGTYDVVTCDVAPGGENRSWTPWTAGRMWTGQHCPTAGREAGGLFAGAGVNVGTIEPFATARQSFEAPPGTSIVYLAARYTFHRKDPYWLVGLFANDSLLHGCQPAARETGCFYRSDAVASEWGWLPGAVQRVAV